MPPSADEPSPRLADAFATGCVLLLVLMADVVGVLAVVFVLALRGLGHMEPSQGQQPAGPPPADWAPVLGWGTLGLVIGVTGLLLLRVGLRGIGTVQLALCVVLAGAALSAWP